MDKEYIGSVLLVKGHLDQIIADIRGLLDLHSDYWWNSIEETSLTAQNFMNWINSASQGSNRIRNYLPSSLAKLSDSSCESNIIHIKRAWGEQKLGVEIYAYRYNKWCADDWIKVRVYDLVRMGTGDTERWEIKVWSNPRGHVRTNAKNVMRAIRQLQ